MVETAPLPPAFRRPWSPRPPQPAAMDSSAAHRDNNTRAAFIHVMADAAVSILAILGLAAGKFFGWVFMDPVMGIIGALVIATWSYGLIRDTGAILLDMNPDRRLAHDLRKTIESENPKGTGSATNVLVSSSRRRSSASLRISLIGYPHCRL